ASGRVFDYVPRGPRLLNHAHALSDQEHSALRVGRLALPATERVAVSSRREFGADRVGDHAVDGPVGGVVLNPDVGADTDHLIRRVVLIRPRVATGVGA